MDLPPEYHAGTLEKYSNLQVKNDLAIAVHPILDEAESKKYFGVDLFDSGVLAVHIVAENKGKSSSYVLSNQNITLELSGIANDKMAAIGRIGSEGGGRALAIGGAAIISLPLTFIGMKMISDATVIKHNMAIKALQRKIVSPGRRVQGFVYFALPKITKRGSGAFPLTIDVLGLKEQSLTHFNFKIRTTR